MLALALLLLPRRAHDRRRPRWTSPTMLASPREERCIAHHVTRQAKNEGTDLDACTIMYDYHVPSRLKILIR